MTIDKKDHIPRSPEEMSELSDDCKAVIEKLLERGFNPSDNADPAFLEREFEKAWEEMLKEKKQKHD